MDQRLSFITLGVRDLNASRRFYLDGLGWTEVEPRSDQICFIQLPSIVLGLYGWEALAEDMKLEPGPTDQQANRFRGFALAYTTASEAETDEVMELALGAGATLLKRPQPVFWGGYAGYFADPDGHPWEVAYNPFTLAGPDGSFVMDSHT